MREDDYKDERWLKRANEIRRLDGYKCAMCGKSDVELHVHHLAYPPKPFHIWDATDDELITLCKDCHREVHNLTERPKLAECRTLQARGSDFRVVLKCDGCAFKDSEYKWDFKFRCFANNIRCENWTRQQCKYCMHFNPYGDDWSCVDDDVIGWCSDQGTNDVYGSDFCVECNSESFTPKFNSCIK